MTLFAVAVLLALAAAGWVVYPIWGRRAAILRDPAPSSVLDAEARKRVALSSLREVEYDWLGGKLDAADYQALRAQLEREALEAVRAAPGEPEIPASGAVSLGGDVHPACGFANPLSSRFCAGCGARLA